MSNAARQAELLAHADRQDAAVDEHRGSGLRRGEVEQRPRPLIVHRDVMHRREQADGAQAALERRSRLRHRISARRIDHEEADEPLRMPRDRRRDRRRVARHTGDQRRARDLMAIELRRPAVGERLGRARRVPSQFRQRAVTAERSRRTASRKSGSERR